MFDSVPVRVADRIKASITAGNHPEAAEELKAALDYEWISGPESFAQTLFHTYLKGKFGERIHIFEEIKTGAGRIDIYLQLKGGLAVVVELNCAASGTPRLAAFGEEQVLHYLENKNTSLGYLIVFDARLDHNGENIMPPRSTDKYTVREIDCDVRPRFGKKASVK